MEKDRVYHKRSLSETALFHYKQLLSSKLTLRDYNAQVGEVLANMKAMNKFIRLRIPVRQQIN
ncbi:Mobile element protein (plasmid) [Candidatus Enterovibrio escicola]|uniref:Mobile element protein n=1 Tax=Candidatus Enterovibrio escicola TaxID=1927127 RepID=A0A2A5T1Q1_9GAMM|nr:Mobile element protein [Candidatus Enterovibrio escacola]